MIWRVCVNTVVPPVTPPTVCPVGQAAGCDCVDVLGVHTPPPIGMQPYPVGLASIIATVGVHIAGHVPGDTQVLDVGTIPVYPAGHALLAHDCVWPGVQIAGGGPPLPLPPGSGIVTLLFCGPGTPYDQSVLSAPGVSWTRIDCIERGGTVMIEVPAEAGLVPARAGSAGSASAKARARARDFIGVFIQDSIC